MRFEGRRFPPLRNETAIQGHTATLRRITEDSVSSSQHGSTELLRGVQGSQPLAVVAGMRGPIHDVSHVLVVPVAGFPKELERKGFEDRLSCSRKDV